MEVSHISQEYIQAVKDIKSAILRSRYQAAKLANKELLKLYYSVGGYVSAHSRDGYWGKGAIDAIAKALQQELPGLRGFSVSNIKNMRMFFEEWSPYINRQLLTGDLLSNYVTTNYEIRQLSTAEFSMTDFMSVGFTCHTEILMRVKDIDERLFYISRCAHEFWTVENLKRRIAEDLYHKEGSIKQTNFQKTISDDDFKKKALQSFKDEYLLDFINIEDPEDTDERVIEQSIIRRNRQTLWSAYSR